MAVASINESAISALDVPTERGKGVRMKKLMLLVAMTVLIPACTHYYVKPGQTAAGFDRDKRECQRIAEKEAARKGTRTCDECEKCLFAKGWQRD